MNLRRRTGSSQTGHGHDRHAAWTRLVRIYSILTVGLVGCDTVVNNNKPYDYSIEQQQGCFCPQMGIWVRLFVKADTIAEAVRISDNVRLSYAERQSYRTIGGLFDVVNRLDTAGFDIRIDFDSLYRYPTYIYFSPKPVRHGDTVQVIYDAQMSYTTRNYIKLN